MSTTTSPGPAIGSGTSTRCNTSGPPCFSNTTAFMRFSPLLLPPQKRDEQLADLLRLLLLHPMPGAVDQVAPHHTRARALLHPLELAAGAQAIPLQTALKARPLVFGPVDAELAVRQPPASRDLGLRRHFRRH